MKVVQVTHSYRPAIGGIENYVYRLNQSLAADGHEVGTLTTTESLNGDTPHPIPDDGTYCRTSCTLFRNPVSVELFSTLRRTDADLYHLHSPFSLVSLEAGLALPTDVPTCLTVHGVVPFTDPTGRLLTRAYRPFAEYLFSHADRTVVLGETERCRLVDTYDVDPSRVVTIPNGIDTRTTDPAPETVSDLRSRYLLDPDVPTVLFTSRMVPKKNPEVLIEAVTDYLDDVDLRVVMIGGGDSTYLEKLTTAADDRFVFDANLTDTELQAAYHLADVFVMLSGAEGLPTVVLEAMAAKNPIVATRAGAIPDLISGGQNGTLVPFEDAKAVASAIRHYVEDDTERIATGERNAQKIEREYAWPVVYEQLTEQYEAITPD